MIVKKNKYFSEEIEELLGEDYSTQCIGKWGEFNDAIVGVGGQHGKEPLIIYCFRQLVKLHMDKFKWKELEAIEFIDFNIKGAWMGKGTPIILDICSCNICLDYYGYVGDDDNE